MAALWETYFDDEHIDQVRSGTPEFMSENLQYTIALHRPYLQSPLDDLHSFFWVGVWSVLFNAKNSLQRSEDERIWQKELESAERNSKVVIATELEEVTIGYNPAECALESYHLADDTTFRLTGG